MRERRVGQRGGRGKLKRERSETITLHAFSLNVKDIIEQFSWAGWQMVVWTQKKGVIEVYCFDDGIPDRRIHLSCVPTCNGSSEEEHILVTTDKWR